jgi:aspartyl-tRNA(Asn)/glutamyl-tRNA(Gln) amidotransferase subunit A
MDLTSLKQISTQLAEKNVSSRELTRYYLDRIAKHDPDVNAFISLDADHAMQSALRIDERRAS